MFPEMAMAMLEPTLPIWLIDTMHPPKWQLGKSNAAHELQLMNVDLLRTFYFDDTSNNWAESKNKFFYPF